MIVVELELIKEQDGLVASLVANINLRYLKLRGYTLVELLFGFILRFDRMATDVKNDLKLLAIELGLLQGEDKELQESLNAKVRMARMEELRIGYTNVRLDLQER